MAEPKAPVLRLELRQLELFDEPAPRVVGGQPQSLDEFREALIRDPVGTISELLSTPKKKTRKRRPLAATTPLNPEGCLDTLEAVFFSANDTAAVRRRSPRRR